MYLLAAPAHSPSSPAPTVNMVHILSAQLSSGTLGARAKGGPPYILVQCRPAAGCKQEMSDVNPKHIINAETEVVQIQDTYMLCYNFYYMCH